MSIKALINLLEIEDEIYEEWRAFDSSKHLFKESIDKLQKEHENGTPAAVYEMLCAALAGDRITCEGRDRKILEWDYTRVPTWAVIAAIETIGKYLKYVQNDGRGRNAKWIKRYWQTLEDEYISFYINAEHKVHEKTLEESFYSVAQEFKVSPETAKKAYYRCKNRPVQYDYQFASDL